MISASRRLESSAASWTSARKNYKISFGATDASVRKVFLLESRHLKTIVTINMITGSDIRSLTQFVRVESTFLHFKTAYLWRRYAAYLACVRSNANCVTWCKLLLDVTLGECQKRNERIGRALLA